MENSTCLLAVRPNQAGQCTLDFNPVSAKNFCFIERVTGFECNRISPFANFLERCFDFIDQSNNDLSIVEGRSKSDDGDVAIQYACVSH